MTAERTHGSQLLEQAENIVQQAGIESAIHVEIDPVALQAQGGAAGTHCQLDKPAG